jgi:hypothetical protein
VGGLHEPPLSRARTEKSRFFRSLPFFMPERFRAELAPSAFRPWRFFQGRTLSGQTVFERAQS